MRAVEREECVEILGFGRVCAEPSGSLYTVGWIIDRVNQ